MFTRALLELFTVVFLVRAQNFRASPCKKGFFLDNSGMCLPLLGCHAMANELKIIEKIHGGFVKDITHVQWNDIDLAYSTPRAFKKDFWSGMELLELFQESRYVVELVGLCRSPMQILTKFYKHGSADGLTQLLTKNNFSESRSFQIKLQVAEDYLNIINFLHINETEPRVMCDSNGLAKTLSQFLITDDFHLVLGDLDALPIVTKSHKGLIKCGHRELFGIFVAPEQLWPYTTKPFDDKEMPGYDEKTDIWKIPDVLYNLLGDSLLSQRLKYGLFDKFRRCKAMLPQDRPTAKELLSYFQKEKDKIALERSLSHNGEL